VKLKLPYDQYATPVNAWDVARAIQLLLAGNHFGTFHIAGMDWVSRQDVATSILKCFPDALHQIEAVSTQELCQPANRPLKGGLIADKFKAMFTDFRFGTIDAFVQSVLTRSQVVF
jgi:dTDP-4-dehydrorhamnose reductase